MIGRGIAGAGVAVAATVIAVLHVAGVGRVNPLARTVSDYVALPDGAALLALAAGGLIVAGFAGAVTLNTTARRLMLIWGAAVLLVAAFPTNLPGQPPDVSAFVHRWAGALVFTLPPVAGAVAARSAGPRRVPLLAASIAAAVTAGAFLLSHAPHVLAGADVFPYLGLVERVAYAALLVLLVVFATPARTGGGDQVLGGADGQICPSQLPNSRSCRIGTPGPARPRAVRGQPVVGATEPSPAATTRSAP